MNTSIIVLVGLSICISCTDPEKGNAIATEVSDSAVKDSTDLITRLYEGKQILTPIEVNSLNCLEITKDSPLIRIECSAKVDSALFGYVLNFSDTSISSTDKFFMTPDDYLYKSSYVYLNDSLIDITKLNCYNTEENISPMIVWESPSSESSAKIYRLPDRNIIIIRGFNFYCRGTNCSNYKLLIIQQFADRSIQVKGINYPGRYPFSFENTFVFMNSGSLQPCIYTIKNEATGEKFEHYEIFPL